MSNRELMLAFEFKSAPKELQELAEKYRVSSKRVDKCARQLSAWEKEHQAAELENNKARKEFKIAMDQWEESFTNVAVKPEEIKNA